MKDHPDKLDLRRRLLFSRGVLAVATLWQLRRAAAHDEHHHHASVAQEIKRTQGFYDIPAETLVRQDGAEVAFPQELNDGRPVILDFIYTSCTTICPVSSMVFAQLQG